MPDARREAVLGQLRYLIDEAEMLRRVVPRLPAALQEATTVEGSRSFKATLALIAARDARVRLPRLLASAAPPPALDEDAVAREAQGQEVDVLLDTLVENRRRLVDAAAALSDAAWRAGALDLLYMATLEDADLLRALAQHLFDAQGMGG